MSTTTDQRIKAPLFSCVDARKFGGPNPGAVIYGRLATTWARQIIWAKKHGNNEMKKSSLQSLTGPIQSLVNNSASNLKPGWFAISCKSHPGFCVYMTSFCYGGNNPANSWCDDLADAAFGKITAVYGHSDENGPFVRKILVTSIPFLRTNAPKRGFCP